MATVALAFEQHTVNHKRNPLTRECTSIRAFHAPNALMFSAHPDMNAQAVRDRPVGTLIAFALRPQW